MKNPIKKITKFQYFVPNCQVMLSKTYTTVTIRIKMIVILTLCGYKHVLLYYVIFFIYLLLFITQTNNILIELLIHFCRKKKEKMTL